MLQGPLLDQTSGRSRSDFAVEQVSIEIEGCPLVLMLGMEMRRGMLAEIHFYDDAKKR